MTNADWVQAAVGGAAVIVAGFAALQAKVSAAAARDAARAGEQTVEASRQAVEEMRRQREEEARHARQREVSARLHELGNVRRIVLRLQTMAELGQEGSVDFRFVQDELKTALPPPVGTQELLVCPELALARKDEKALAGQAREEIEKVIFAVKAAGEV